MFTGNFSHVNHLPSTGSWAKSGKAILRNEKCDFAIVCHIIKSYNEIGEEGDIHTNGCRKPV